MKLIIGLGNPGAKYRASKHNIGFITLDEMAFQLGVAFNKSQFNSVYAEARVGTEKAILIKPQTFMNRSGESVQPWMNYYHLLGEDVVVIYDDMDLTPGKVRLREQGSAGGHNGIKSIIKHLGTKKFNRIKIGIGRPLPKQSVVSHVLSQFSDDTYEAMLSSVRKAYDASYVWLEGHPFQTVMSQFN